MVPYSNLIWLTNPGNEYEGAEDERKRLASGSDPVHTVHTFEFVKQHLGGLVAAAGMSHSALIKTPSVK